MSFHGLVNTRYFSEAAIDWTRNGGKYTLAPTGSREYREYWEMQEARCRMGYSVGDTWITGRHYHQLNFAPMLKLPDAKVFAMLKEMRDKHGKIGKVTMEKVMEFPRFYEIGWEWNRFKFIGRNGGRFQNVVSPGGKNLCAAKCRGAGFSYMEAADAVYNYTLIPGSLSYFFASTEQYLTTDGILNKAKMMMDWTNVNIPYWAQNRMEHDTLMHMKASYRDAFGNIRGNLSEIIGTIVDNPNKTRGKRGIKIVFEEGGSFKRLKEALAVSIGAIQDGSVSIGQIVVFGTGGEEGPSIEGLEEIHDQPDVYNMLAFPNIWEEGMEHDTCGYFVPITKADIMFMDEDGNCDVEAATAKQMEIREEKSKAKDPKELDRYKAEYPLVPKEVFQRLARNPFNVNEIRQQENYILKSAAVQELIRYGMLVSSPEGGENGMRFQIMKKEDAKPLEDYPHDQRGDLEGCLTVVEKPYLDINGNTPAGIYQIIFDGCYKDEADDMTSLWDTTVWKNYNQVSSINENMPVAWDVSRPKDLQDAIRRLFNLAQWYNGTIQGEIAGGGQAVLDYAKRHHLLHKLDFDLEITDNREITEKKNRSYLMNMPTEKKRMGLTYFINWMMEQRGIRDDGSPIYNVHKLLKLRLLRECRKFDGKKNADSISNAIVAMFSLKEKVTKLIQQAAVENDFYSRELFSSYAGEEEGFVDKY